MGPDLQHRLNKASCSMRRHNHEPITSNLVRLWLELESTEQPAFCAKRGCPTDNRLLCQNPWKAFFSRPRELNPRAEKENIW